MRLVIVRSDATGMVSLPSEQVFGDPAEAAAKLAECYASGVVDAADTCYALDLDTAMPVVVVPHESPKDEPAAEEPVRSEDVEQPLASAPDEEVLEESEPASASWNAAPEARVEVPVEFVAEPAATAPEPPVAAEVVHEPPMAAEDEPGEWPWNLPEVPAEEPHAEEPGAEGPQDEPAFAPAASMADDLVVLPDASEDLAVDDPRDAMGEAEAAAVAEPQGVLEVVTVAETETAEAPEHAESAYEPGILNMNQYTCDDCVYVNTCPNQHQKAPAECGSFQWRSV